MATATLTLAGLPNEGSGWTVTITDPDLLSTTAVNSDASYNGATVSVTEPINLGVIFTMPADTQTESFQTYGGQYATWRSSTAITGLSNSQYPTQGFSLDIWGGASTLITNINAGNTWAQLASGGPYNLSSDKYSLIYNYASSYPPIFSKGGTLTISVA
jgi:hypothetical protein